MDTIASLFLRAKHWQIFLLLVGVGFVGDVVAIASSISVTAQSPEVFGKIGLPLGFVMTLFMFCFLGWFWSMGSFLSSIVQPPLRLKTGFFRFALVYPGLYIFVFMPLFLIWFFPVGVWFTQPRINRLYAERRNIEPLTGGASG